MASNVQQQMPIGHPNQVHWVAAQLKTTSSMLANQTWHSSLSPQDRMNKAMELITGISLASPSLDVQNVAMQGCLMEREAYLKAPTKENYDQAMNARIAEMWRKRQFEAPALQRDLNENARLQGQPQGMINMQQMGRGMVQQGFQQMPQSMQPGQMTPQQRLQQQQQLQLQRMQQQHQAQQHQAQQHQAHQQKQQQQPQGQQQMGQVRQQLSQQLSQQQQMGMGMGMNIPNQAGRGMPPNQQMGGMPSAQSRQNPPAGQGEIARLTAQDRAKVMEIATTLLAKQNDQQKHRIMMQLRQRIGAQTLANIQAQNRDPLLLYFQQQALNLWKQQNFPAARQQAAQQQAANLPQASMMQQQSSQHAHQQPGMINNGQQPVGDMSRFGPNVESIQDQQLSGLMAQKAGQMVVPVSSAPSRTAGSQQMAPSRSNQHHPNQPQRQAQQSPQPQPAGVQQMGMNLNGQPMQGQMPLQQGQVKPMQGQQPGIAGGMGSGQGAGMGTLNTPVSRPPTGMNQLGGQVVGQGATTFSDPRFNQSVQPPNAQVFSRLLSEIPDDMRQKFMSLPPDQLHEAMRRYQIQRHAQLARSQGPQQMQNQMANRAAPGGLGQMNPAIGTPGQQGMQQPANMMNHSQGQPQPNVAMMQQMMDSLDLPPPLIQQLSQYVPVGPDMKKWGHLKRWLQTNLHSIPPQFRNTLGQFQRAQWQQLVSSRQQAAAAGPPQPGQNFNNTARTGMQNSTVQILQPEQTGPQMGQNMPTDFSATAEEIASLRTRKPQLSAMPDENLRAMVVGMKRQQWQNTQAKANRQMSPTQVQPGTQGPGPQTGAGTVAVPQTPMQRQPVAAQANSVMFTQPQQQQQRVAETASQNRPMQPTDSKTQGTGSQQPASTKANKKSQSATQTRKNLKRPSSGDMSDVTSSNQHQKAPQPSSMASLPQQPPPTSAVDNLSRLRAMVQEEQATFALQKMPNIPMSPQERAEVSKKLKLLVPKVYNLGRTLVKWFNITQDDNRARLFFRTRLRLVYQFADGEAMKVQKTGPLTIRSVEVDSATALFDSMIKDMAHNHAATKARQAQQGQAGQQQNVTASQAMQRAQSQQKQGQPATSGANNATDSDMNPPNVKQTGKNFKVPAAPTTSQPPSFGFAAQSPHGNPSYANQSVNMELKMPQRKRAKISQTAQPSQPATPPTQATKPSPRHQTQETQQARPTETPRPVIVCKEPECELSQTGYANNEALQKHIEEEHMKPREDPLKFAHDSLAVALGLDLDGNSKDGQRSSTDMALSTSKQGQTPGTLGIGTPVSQDGSAMRRSASAQQGSAKVSGKEDGKGVDASQVVDPWDGATLDPKALLTTLGLEGGIHNAIYDVNAFRTLTPKDTPESVKDSGGSEPNSDISEGAVIDIDVNWQAFDTFETDLLVDLDNTNLQQPTSSFEAEVPTMDPSLLFTSEVPDWDDVNIDFTKPFRFENSLYSMDIS